MKLSSSSEVLAENKVLILYILDQINEPVLDSTLLEVVSSVTDLNYFYFQQFLLDLLGSKYIIKYEKDDNTFYELSPDGKRILDLTISIIPGIMKLRVDTNLKPCIDKIAEELSVISDFTPDGENGFFVDCKIIDRNKVIFSIKVSAGSREQAKIIVDNWKKNAVKIYPKLLETLSNTEI